MGKKIRFRFWIFLNSLLEIYYKFIDRKQWYDLRPKAFRDDFLIPLKTGHIPVRFFDSLLEDEFLPKPRLLNSVKTVKAITNNVSANLYGLLGRPYDETRVIKRYALVLIAHFDSCDHCQAEAVRYAVDLQAFRFQVMAQRGQNDLC